MIESAFQMKSFPRRRWQEAAILGLFLAAGLGLASPGLRAPFILDDQIRIVENLDIRSLKNLPQKLVYPYGPYPVYTRNDPSRPLVSLTYALNYHFGKLDPFGYHLFDALTHIGTAFLIFLYLRRLLSKFGVQGAGSVSFLAGAYFLSHPAIFGTAMYAYGRTDTLSGFLLLLTLDLYTRAPGARSVANLLALAGFVLALLAKESAVVVPVIFIAQDYLARKRGVDEKVDIVGNVPYWRRWLPFLAVAALYVAGRWAYFGAIGDLVGGKNAWSRWAYATVQPFVVVQYLRLLFVPVGLAIDHFIQPSTLTTDDEILGFLTLAGLGVALWRWARGGAPEARVALFLGVVFLVLLAPTSSFFPTVDALVERRLYPAGAAVIAVGLLVLGRLGARAFPSRSHVILGAALIPLAFFSPLTIQRNRTINDPAEVWKDVLNTYPDSPRALNNRAVLLQVRGKPDEAFDLYARLIAFNPNDYIAHMNIARILENPSSSHADRARARAHYETAVQIEPAFADGHYNFGRFLQVEGDIETAEKEYLRVLEINPAYVQAHNNLGLLYLRQGRREEASAHIRRALDLDPTYAPAQANLGMLEEATDASGLP